MKVTTSAGIQLHGKAGKFVFYTVDGKTYARSASEKDEPGGWGKTGRSERQRESSARFASVARFYNFYRERVPLDIWGVAARAAGRRANGLFFSLNHGCFDGEGRLSKPELFRFSEGSLALPPGLRVEALGERRFRVAWEQESERASCAPTDRLVVGVIPDDPRLIVYLAEGPEARRRDGEGTFSLRERPAVGSRVYVFFAREDGGAFSPSACFPVRY